MPEKEREMEELRKRVKHLEERLEMLISIADPDRRPFTYLALEMDLTKAQVRAILDLMNRARETLQTPTPMSHAAFEQAIYEIVPSRKGDYHFAESIILTLHDTHEYDDVYEHMKKDGMNI